MSSFSFSPRHLVTRIAFILPLLAGAFAVVSTGAEPMRIRTQDPVRTAEVMPAFPGGNEALSAYIMDHVTYPEAAKKAGAEGTVYVHFVVAADGSIGDVKVPRPVNPDLEAEAMRVVRSMPSWTPGKQGGKAIPVLMTLPVSFKLSDK